MAGVDESIEEVEELLSDDGFREQRYRTRA